MRHSYRCALPVINLAHSRKWPFKCSLCAVLSWSPRPSGDGSAASCRPAAFGDGSSNMQSEESQGNGPYRLRLSRNSAAQHAIAYRCACQPLSWLLMLLCTPALVVLMLELTGTSSSSTPSERCQNPLGGVAFAAAAGVDSDRMHQRNERSERMVPIDHRCVRVSSALHVPTYQYSLALNEHDPTVVLSTLPFFLGIHQGPLLAGPPVFRFLASSNKVEIF